MIVKSCSQATIKSYRMKKLASVCLYCFITARLHWKSVGLEFWRHSLLHPELYNWNL